LGNKPPPPKSFTTEDSNDDGFAKKKMNPAGEGFAISSVVPNNGKSVEPEKIKVDEDTKLVVSDEDSEEDFDEDDPAL